MTDKFKGRYKGVKDRRRQKDILGTAKYKSSGHEFVDKMNTKLDLRYITCPFCEKNKAEAKDGRLICHSCKTDIDMEKEIDRNNFSFVTQDFLYELNLHDRSLAYRIREKWKEYSTKMRDTSKKIYYGNYRRRIVHP